MTSVNTNVPCKGNGKVLGLSNGSLYGGLYQGTSSVAGIGSGGYGANYGGTTSNANTPFTAKTNLGVTTDATKSGIVGTVTRNVLSVRFIIKY